MSQGMKLTGILILAVGAFLLAGPAPAGQDGNTAPVAAAATAATSGPEAVAAPVAAPVSAVASKSGAAPSPTASKAASGPAGSSASSSSRAAIRDNEALLVEGEKRFATNCGRCHQSPHHFPPRMMATVVRHMRVRATITDTDMRLILLYLTQ